MILTDYYKAERLTGAKSRYDITASTGEYDLFESLLINKRGFNVGGMSFYCGERPNRWKKKNSDLAISKGCHNITSLIRPDITLNYATGDINSTLDGCIIIFNPDYRKVGISIIEVFIARGLKNDINCLWNLLVDEELNPDMELLKQKAVTKSVTDIN